MATDEDYDAALARLARAEGKSVEQLRNELIREHLKEHLVKGGAGPLAQAPVADRFDGDASRSGMSDRSKLAERRGEVVSERYRDETPEAAKERWYEQEAELTDGVHGLGGSTGGGIFGDGPIATPEYDPASDMRAEGRATSALQVRVLRTLERLEGHLGRARPPRSLPSGSPRKRLR